MARTPLLTKFQQLFEDFSEAEPTGRTVGDVQQQRLHRGPTRREVLKAGGAALAAATVLGPARLFGASAPRIVIVGGGIAGLNTALSLQDAGYGSTIYEASSRVGGRMHSDTTSWADGQVSEHCGELIDSVHKVILGLANRFDIPVDDLLGAQPLQSTATYFFFGDYYTRDQANIDFKPVYNAVKKDLTAASFPTLYNLYNQAGWDLDHLSLYDWIETRVPGGHGSRMGQLLDVAYNIEYRAENPIQSPLNLGYLLAFQPYPGNFREFGRSDERYHLRGGNERLPKAIAAALRPGTIQFNTSLTAIAKNNDGSYALSFTSGGTKFTKTADPVIMAIPFSSLHNLAYSQAGLRQREPWFPGIRQEWDGRATLGLPSGNPYLLGSCSYWKVGQYTQFSGSERERSGKCHCAGEHCSINFQGFMEGGAEEGARAVNMEILSDYKAGIFP